MDRLSPRPPDRLLGSLAGLADPTRLRLLHLVERTELGVAELCEVLRLPQSTVSRHLKVLADSGFVAGRADGTSRLYRLADLDPGARRLWRAAREQAQGWAALEQDELRLARRLAERRDCAERFFAGAAGDWERLRVELYGGGFLLEALLALLPRELVVADLGCGTGDLAARLGRHVRRVDAVDRSAAMLRAARRRVRRPPERRAPPGRARAAAARGRLAATRRSSSSSSRTSPTRARCSPRPPASSGPEAAPSSWTSPATTTSASRSSSATRARGSTPPTSPRCSPPPASPPRRVHPLPPDPGARGPALLVASAERPATPRGGRVP